MVRASALFDLEATFLKFLHASLAAGRPVDCYEDAYYSPTYLPDFLQAIERLLEASSRAAVMHVAGTRISRFAFARLFAEAFGYPVDLITPTTLPPDATALFPDLSLDTSLAAAEIAFFATPHGDALARLACERTV